MRESPPDGMKSPSMKPFYITTAIDYTNAPPHIGHAYEKVLADVMARFQRLNGREVYFLTGVDQHGQKVQKSAEKAGQSPAEFVEGGLEVVDDEVEEGVGEAVGPTDEDARGAENAFAAGLDGLEGAAVVGDEEVLPQDEIELGGGEFLGAGVVDGVGDDVDVVLVLLVLGERGVLDAVLDGERVDGEEVLVAVDARSFAAQVARLYGDAALWRRLSQRGQAVARSRYSRQAVRGSLEAMVAEFARPCVP